MLQSSKLGEMGPIRGEAQCSKRFKFDVLEAANVAARLKKTQGAAVTSEPVFSSPDTDSADVTRVICWNP